MIPTVPDPDFPLKSSRFKKIFINLAILFIANSLHFVFQLQLGSLIAGSPSTDLPETTQVSLLALVLIFFSVPIGLFAHTGNLVQNLRGKSLIFFFLAASMAIAAVLAFRVPYSNVFLFWGIILQIMIWYVTVSIFERLNRPIIGIPSQSLPDFQNLVPPDFVRIISPDMHEPAEINLIVLKETELASPEWSGFLMQCFLRSIAVEEHTNLMERLSNRVDLDHFSFRNSVQLVRENNYLPLKRLIDIALSAFLLLAFSPFMALIAVLIRIESRGHPIFSQSRVGLSGRPFTIYKFRSMQQAKDDVTAKFAAKDDARVTPFGKMLRKSRIDELPQLWNVLIGDMSLIGPRPEQADLTDSIQNEIPLFSLRHSLRPGITGWAQIRQGYADDMATTRTKLSYDLWYVKNASLLVDVSIALQTVKVMFTGFGSR